MPQTFEQQLKNLLDYGFEVVAEHQGDFVTVTEVVKRDERGETYNYLCPTHWCNDGIVRVSLTKGLRSGSTNLDYSYGSGGWNPGFEHAEYADALATAHRAAANRVLALQPEVADKLAEKYGKDTGKAFEM